MMMDEFTTLLARIDAVAANVADCQAKLGEHLAVARARASWFHAGRPSFPQPRRWHRPSSLG